MKAENYAHALMRLIEKREKPTEAVKKMHTILDKQGRAALLPSIGRAFERLASKTMNRNRHVLFIARTKDKAKARRESAAVDAEVVINENLIGGWRLEAGERLQDASWKNHLLNIYQNSTK